MSFCIFWSPGIFLAKRFLFTLSVSIMLTRLGLWSRSGSHFDILKKGFCFLKETCISTRLKQKIHEPYTHTRGESLWVSKNEMAHVPVSFCLTRLQIQSKLSTW